MTATPELIRARELACAAKLRGGALERGIMTGHCDNGTLVQDYVEEAKLDLLRTPEEYCPDD